MIRSLQGIASRVERLARQVEPSEHDLRARLDRLTNGELELELVRMFERVAGPVTAFETCDAFIAAYHRRFRTPLPPKEVPLEAARAHWQRHAWPLAHRQHGTLHVIEPVNCVRPPSGLSGPGIVVACRCGARLSILHELVPPGLEALPRHAVSMESDFVPPWPAS